MRTKKMCFKLLKFALAVQLAMPSLYAQSLPNSSSDDQLPPGNQEVAYPQITPPRNIIAGDVTQDVPEAENHKRHIQPYQDENGNQVLVIHDIISIKTDKDLAYAKAEAQKALDENTGSELFLHLTTDVAPETETNVFPESVNPAEVEKLKLPISELVEGIQERSKTDGFLKNYWARVKGWYTSVLDRAAKNPDKFDTKIAIMRGVGVGVVFFTGLMKIDGLSWSESFAATSSLAYLGNIAGGVSAGAISFGFQKKMKDYSNWIPRAGRIARAISYVAATSMYLRGAPGLKAHANMVNNNFLDKQFRTLQFTNESTKFYTTEYIVLSIIAGVMYAAQTPLASSFDEWAKNTAWTSFLVLLSQGVWDIALSKHKSQKKLEIARQAVDEGLLDKSFLQLPEKNQLAAVDRIEKMGLSKDDETLKTRFRRVETETAFQFFLLALGTNFGAALDVAQNSLGPLILWSFSGAGAMYLGYVSEFHKAVSAAAKSFKKGCSELLTGIGRTYK